MFRMCQMCPLPNIVSLTLAWYTRTSLAGNCPAQNIGMYQMGMSPPQTNIFIINPKYEIGHLSKMKGVRDYEAPKLLTPTWSQQLEWEVSNLDGRFQTRQTEMPLLKKVFNLVFSTLAWCEYYSQSRLSEAKAGVGKAILFHVMVSNVNLLKVSFQDCSSKSWRKKSILLQRTCLSLSVIVRVDHQLPSSKQFVGLKPPCPTLFYNL